MRTGIVAWLWSRLVTSVSEEKSLHIMWTDSWDRRGHSASDLFMAKRARQGARGHLDRLPAVLRSKWVRETNYLGLGKTAQVSRWQAPAGSRIFNPGISRTGFCKIPGSRDFSGRD